MSLVGSLRIALVCAAALLFAGCSTTPPVPAGSLMPGDRVGVLVQATDHPLHVHVGFMVFGNFNKTYPYTWQVGRKVFDALDKTVRGSGLETIDLAKQGIGAGEVAGLVQIQDKKWVVAPGKEAMFQHLRDDLKVKALVVLTPARVMALNQCTQFGCTEFYIDGPGITSRPFATFLTAVAGYRWSVVNLVDVADLALASPISSEMRIPTRTTELTDSSEDVVRWGSKEWVQVEDSIAEFSADVMELAVRQLKKER